MCCTSDWRQCHAQKQHVVALTFRGKKSWVAYSSVGGISNSASSKAAGVENVSCANVICVTGSWVDPHRDVVERLPVVVLL